MLFLESLRKKYLSRKHPKRIEKPKRNLYHCSAQNKLLKYILVAKHRCLKIANNKVIVEWNCHNYFTQTILLAQFTVKLLQQTNSAAAI